MLSAESAAGKYPVAAVRMMDNIIAEVEADPHYRQATDAAHPAPDATVSDVICYAVRQAASILPVAAVVTYTTSGWTSLRAARERPAAPILSLTPDIRTARRLCLVWGTYPVQTPEAEHVAEIVEYACATAATKGYAGPGDLIAIAAGMPFGVAGTTTNLLRIARLPGGPA
jgi:pyruvate kinase